MIRCCNGATIYIDGEFVSRTENDNTTILDVEETARVIAIRCRRYMHDGGPNGLIVSFSNGFTSDKTWRCSGTSASGWNEMAFNDNSWKAAYVIDLNGTMGSAFKNDPHFPDEANWIRGNNMYTSTKNSYCRGKLVILQSFLP